MVQKSPATEDRRVSKKRILLVDDENRVREVIALTLGQENFLILQAASGREAVELARAERPDLILVDLLMPEMDGLEVCRLLKADPSTAGIKVFILTARSGREEEARAWAAGADGFFSKPFSPMSLLNKIYEAVE